MRKVGTAGGNGSRYPHHVDLFFGVEKSITLLLSAMMSPSLSLKKNWGGQVCVSTSLFERALFCHGWVCHHRGHLRFRFVF
jgi:hypothetical protein